MDERAAWDLFWSYDRLSSFGTGSGAGNYGEHIAGGWRDFFASRAAGSRVLDLCTGNGAIAVMAVEAGNDLKVTGVDLAKVKPAAYVSSSKAAVGGVEFVPNTPAEELPFKDASFDAVVSQYGVEYSDLQRSVPEAVRILAPKGHLRFACHAAEGSVAADTRLAIADADFLLDHIDLIGLASDCLRSVLAVERGRDGPVERGNAQLKYGAFRDALKAVADRSRTAADAAMLASMHRSLTDLFQQRQGKSDAEIETRLGSLRQEVEAHRERQRQLLQAARSNREMHELGKTLEELGMVEIKVSPQLNGSNLIGHVIEARGT